MVDKYDDVKSRIFTSVRQIGYMYIDYTKITPLSKEKELQKKLLSDITGLF